MKTFLLQVHLNRFLFLVNLMSSLSVSFLIRDKAVDHITINSSYPGKNDRFLRPIIVPNLTVSWSHLSSPRGESLLEKMAKLKAKDLTEGQSKVFSEDSTVPFNDGRKSDVNPVHKFSSRYAFGSGSALSLNDKNKIAEKKPKNKNKIFTDQPRASSLLENQNENGEPPKNTITPHLISHSDSKEIKGAKPLDEDVNEAKDEEKVVASIAISKPQKPTSFSNEPQKSYFSDEEYEDGEGFLDDDSDDGEKLEEAEDDIDKNFFHDFDENLKDYNSVQTPLKDIKYRGDGFGGLHNDFDNHFDYNVDWKKPKMRLLQPMERYHSGYPWSFTRERETENSTLKNIKNSSVKSGARDDDSPLKISEKPQKIQLTGNEKNNPNRGRNRGSKKFNSEPDADKAKDMQEVNRSAINVITQTGNELNSSKKFFTPEERRNQYSKNEKVKVIRPTTYNSTWTIKDDLTPKKIHSKHNDLSKEKTAPSKKEWQQDNRNNINTGNQRKSFDHLQESDEVYNQILSNIQSVFGLRTGPLKSFTLNSSASSKIKPEESRVSGKISAI